MAPGQPAGLGPGTPPPGSVPRLQTRRRTARRRQAEIEPADGSAELDSANSQEPAPAKDAFGEAAEALSGGVVAPWAALDAHEGSKG